MGESPEDRKTSGFLLSPLALRTSLLFLLVALTFLYFLPECESAPHPQPHPQLLHVVGNLLKGSPKKSAPATTPPPVKRKKLKFKTSTVSTKRPDVQELERIEREEMKKANERRKAEERGEKEKEEGKKKKKKKKTTTKITTISPNDDLASENSVLISTVEPSTSMPKTKKTKPTKKKKETKATKATKPEATKPEAEKAETTNPEEGTTEIAEPVQKIISEDADDADKKAGEIESSSSSESSSSEEEESTTTSMARQEEERIVKEVVTAAPTVETTTLPVTTVKTTTKKATKKQSTTPEIDPDPDVARGNLIMKQMEAGHGDMDMSNYFQPGSTNPKKRMPTFQKKNKATTKKPEAESSESAEEELL